MVREVGVSWDLICGNVSCGVARIGFYNIKISAAGVMVSVLSHISARTLSFFVYSAHPTNFPSGIIQHDSEKVLPLFLPNAVGEFADESGLRGLGFQSTQRRRNEDDKCPMDQEMWHSEHINMYRAFDLQQIPHPPLCPPLPTV
jgi:hypothetical protein